MLNENKIKEQELFYFCNDLQWIETQELDLIFDPLSKSIMPRSKYNKLWNMMEWECAICGDKILIDKTRCDVENFVCDRCRESHNNKNEKIDIRILNSRTKLYDLLKENIFLEFEDNIIQ